MGVLKGYEARVLGLLASNVLSPAQLEAVVREGEFTSYEYTGNGYFLTLRHSSLPIERLVCSSPTVRGHAAGVNCGFLIFIENGELTIECHSWGQTEMPEGFRDTDVEVAAVRSTPLR